MTLALFAQLASLSTEERWKKVLINMSEGIMPNRFVYCPEQRRLSYDKQYIIIYDVSILTLNTVTSFITRCSSGYNGTYPIGDSRIAKGMVPYHILCYCRSRKIDSDAARRIMQAHATGIIKRADMTFQNGKLVDITGIQVTGGQVTLLRDLSMRSYDSGSASSSA